MRFGVRCDYQSFFDDIKEIELAFFNVKDFLRLNIGDVIKEIKNRNLEIVTVHAPNAKIHRIEEFKIVIEDCCILANKFGCDTVVLRPLFFEEKIY